jgi:DNA-binding Lrp family transcriptional regulator
MTVKPKKPGCNVRHTRSMPNEVRRPRTATTAAPSRRSGPPPTTRPQGLDDLDRQLIDLLSTDGRMPNAALAEALGIAPSTCLARLRALRERGVIRGFHADLDLALLGRPIQAMVSVRLSAHDREAVDRFRAIAPRLPGVLSVYHVTGSTDYLLHVAVTDPAALRDVVLDRVVALPEVAHAETSLIFEHVRGEAPLA